MGRFSLEFGRKGPEGLKAEHDEDLIDDTLSGDGSEIEDLLKDLDMSMDEDYSDCEKTTADQPELDEAEDFSDCEKKAKEEPENPVRPKKEPPIAGLGDQIAEPDEVLQYDSNDEAKRKFMENIRARMNGEAR